VTDLTHIKFRTKLLILITVISCMAITLTITATTVMDYYRTRLTTIQGVITHADVIASNSAAAVVFNDPDSAHDALAALRAVPNIKSAHIFIDSDEPFATYGEHASVKHHDALPQVAVWSLTEGVLVASREIRLEGERVGWITLYYDMHEVRHHVIHRVLISVVIMVLALGIALLFAIALQRTLTKPVVELERIARDVSQNQDYAVRAAKYSNDELGSLTDSFNDMLRQVQSRDRDLADARDRLEDEVAQRTKELEYAKAKAERAAESLAQSEARIRSILKQAPDGIITFDATGRISLANPAAEKIFGRNQDEMADLRVNALLNDRYRIDHTGAIQKLMPGDARKALGRAAEITAHRGDGVELPILIAISHTDLGSRGELTAVIRDISDRVRAEQEKELLNRRIVEESRRSGMAEIATGVLHNVGNVLTSVNVSVNLLNDRLSKSKVPSLIKAADLIKQHEDDLPAFIGGDDRGKHLPGFIVQVAHHLDDEVKQTIDEIKALVDSTQHVQEIISTQQSYASSGGVVELVDLNDIVKDALRINEAGLQRHNVKLKANYDGLPEVIIDKHKVLQILVNLISNAKYAADPGKDQSQIKVSIRIENEPERYVRIEVTDNGIGIDQDNLVRIFNHGFTTRVDGHGFGLHNAALAAKELEGSLQAFSDGPGQGASFVLTLPIKSNLKREGVSHDPAA